MPRGGPRKEEQIALSVIRSVENVTNHKWLCPPGPDLRVTLGNSREVTVEITMSTNRAIREIHGAAEKMPLIGARRLSHHWQAVICDGDISFRKESRRLKELVEAMVPVLQEVESQGGTPMDMGRRATSRLEPDRCRHYGAGRGWWTGPFAEARPTESTYEEWVRGYLLEHCDYWYILDILDWQLDNLEPRRVEVDILQPSTANGNRGITAEPMPSEHAFLLNNVDYLVPAIQKAIDHKEKRGQMDNVHGEKWLVVPLEAPNAASQLEEAFGDGDPPYPDMKDIQFSVFDEVWAFAKTFHGQGFAILRLFGSGRTPRFYTRGNTP